MSEEQRLARRLSGALGRKVDPSEIEVVDADYVLMDGQLVGLLRGNCCFYDGSWWRNGVELSEQEADRLLPREPSMRAGA
jgi:hypothetical protein